MVDLGFCFDGMHYGQIINVHFVLFVLGVNLQREFGISTQWRIQRWHMIVSMSHCSREPQRKMHSMLNNALFSSRRQPKYLPNRLQRPESRRILHCWHIILNRNSIPKWMACESIAAKWWADCAQFSCRFYTLRFDRSHPSDPIQKILSTTYLFRYFIECRN